MGKEENNRIQWIDYSKAVGIILVVIAHALSKENYLNIYSYSFHLPLFFVLGGYTIKEADITHNKFIDVIKKNINNIIVPYYFYTMFIMAIELIKNLLQNDITTESTIRIVSRWLFLVGLKADWFLPCLFFSKIMFIFFARLFKNERFLCIVLLVVALLIMNTPVQPLYLRPEMLGFIGSFFVSIGFFYRKYSIILEKSPQLMIVVIWSISSYINGKVSLLIYDFGKYNTLYLINGILGSLVVFFLMQLLEKKTKKIKSLIWLGKNSLIIMVVHMEIMAFINAIARKIPLISANSFLLKTSIIVLTLSISIAVTPMVDSIYKKIFKKA